MRLGGPGIGTKRQMLFNIKEFESLEDYSRWLTIMGERVQVISMRTLRKRWSVEGGKTLLKPTPLYLVTYKEINSDELGPPMMPCAHCGALNSPRFRFCGDCGTPLFTPE